MRRNMLIMCLAMSIVSLSACGNKDDTFETAPSLEVIQPTETETETLSDKLDETKSFTVPTIGTTEATGKDGDEETVGITETLEDDSYIAVLPDDDVMVTMNVPELSSGHEYTESEAIAIEGLIQYWSENNISKEVLANRLNDDVYSSLTDIDKNEIVEYISSQNPHNNPTITEEVEETTSPAEEIAEESSSDNSLNSKENSQKIMDQYFGGNGISGTTGDHPLSD